MTLQHFIQAIQECDNGQLQFNLGNPESFLFEKKWYPLRATLRRAAENAGDPEITTTQGALDELVSLGLWTRVKKISFHLRRPVDINQNELIEEVKALSGKLFRLTR